MSGENAPRRKSMPNDHQQLLTIVSTASVGRSNSFTMPKSTATSSNSGPAENGGSKSLPSSPVELADVKTSEQAMTSSSRAAGSPQRTKTAWTKVKDIVTTARRGSTDMQRERPDERSSSAERCRVISVDDEVDPWIEKRALSTAPGRDDRAGRSSASPPRSGQRQDQKRFSVSHAMSISAAGTALSNSPLDLAGLLGKSERKSCAYHDNVSDVNTKNRVHYYVHKNKGKEEYLYIAFIQRLVSRRSDMDHTVLPANYTMPAFPS